MYVQMKVLFDFHRFPLISARLFIVVFQVKHIVTINVFR